MLVRRLAEPDVDDLHLAIVAGFRDFAAGLQTGIRRAQRVLSFQGTPSSNRLTLRLAGNLPSFPCR